ncbi:MAG TPA: hypothetical protein VLK60_02170 [Variovorax sp.]|nr:hypothetical protein [Variovorax sp.]
MKHLLCGAAIAWAAALSAPVAAAAPGAADKSTPPGDPAWRRIAGEGERFVLSEPARVRYGVAGRHAVRVLPAGDLWCDSQHFAGEDPAHGVAKACEVSNEAGLRAAPLPRLAPLPEPEVALDVSTPEGYRAVAATIGTQAGIVYRYGRASARAGTAYDGPRPTRSYASLAHDAKVRQADGVIAQRGCSVDGYCGVYSIGDRLFGAPDDYSSTIANVAFLPVRPVARGIYNKRYPGFASIEVLNMGHNTMSVTPQPSWTTYGGSAANNADTDENVARYAGLQPGLPFATVPLNDRPVASTRGYGRGGWTTNAIGVMSDGWIFGYGSNTSHNFMARKVLPDGMTPLGIAISNSGEFAVMPVWDTAAYRGRIAVIALSDACQGCAGRPEAEWGANWGNHRQEYPGLPGLGNYSGAKLIGFVDLPDSIRAPTEIAITTGKVKSGWGYQRIQSFWDSHLLTAENRRRYHDGDWTTAIPRTGMVAVVSKSEKKAAFIDLRPLFQYYREQYFNKGQADWNQLIASRGDAPTQWPYSFDVAPAQRPRLIKVIDLPSAPTAVELTRNAPHRALIGRLDGKLSVYDLGERYLDQTAAKVGSPDDIKPLFDVQIGENVTSIAFKKEIPDWKGSFLYAKDKKSPEQFFWASSRGTNTARLIEFNNAMTAASVRLTLQDPSIRDMLKVEDADNHGTESYVLTIADYEGEGVHNFLYGPITMHTAKQSVAPCPEARPCRLLGGKPFERGGFYRLPGKPFDLSSSNIN